jgi:hypothetical protein
MVAAVDTASDLEDVEQMRNVFTQIEAEQERDIRQTISLQQQLLKKEKEESEEGQGEVGMTSTLKRRRSLVKKAKADGGVATRRKVKISEGPSPSSTTTTHQSAFTTSFIGERQSPAEEEMSEVEKRRRRIKALLSDVDVGSAKWKGSGFVYVIFIRLFVSCI